MTDGRGGIRPRDEGARQQHPSRPRVVGGPRVVSSDRVFRVESSLNGSGSRPACDRFFASSSSPSNLNITEPLQWQIVRHDTASRIASLRSPPVDSRLLPTAQPCDGGNHHSLQAARSRKVFKQFLHLVLGLKSSIAQYPVCSLSTVKSSVTVLVICNCMSGMMA